jgi:hypothetical protein
MSDEAEKNILEFMKTNTVVSEPHPILYLQENINQFIENLIEKNEGTLTKEEWEKNSVKLDNIIVKWYYHIFLEKNNTNL